MPRWLLVPLLNVQLVVCPLFCGGASGCGAHSGDGDVSHGARSAEEDAPACGTGLLAGVCCGAASRHATGSDEADHPRDPQPRQPQPGCPLGDTCATCICRGAVVQQDDWPLAEQSLPAAFSFDALPAPVAARSFRGLPAAWALPGLPDGGRGVRTANCSWLC